ncbi:hypothetical protein QBC32DRAFT_367995 [Pseudoneurospora amorphoporcata]|uniref:Uncharacterized protein n=1 Tax=Pseudoneurospora amorphoporcata TaxID=241081 RepID=A0AAN6P213_9PEZI|nr:hypothetical protein QBC32DRAFT_367995 [Pseudoneurospora amorphoporcata]
MAKLGRRLSQNSKMLITMPSQRKLFTIVLGICAFSLILLIAHSPATIENLPVPHALKPSGGKTPDDRKHKPKYKSPPKYTPPPIKDNFPLLSSEGKNKAPPIPSWNVSPKDLWTQYNLPTAPPLLIGFTRSWPMLQQTVVSYLTAGWPATQIYVVENTGTQQANARGQLSLQNPFYLNHTVLKDILGVNIIQTPTLLNFAQLQNFYLAQSYERQWPYYFWSHMDVLALSNEEGNEKNKAKWNEEGYKSLYAMALTTLKDARENDPKWAVRFFAYDHLALVNPEAYEDVGGWDTLIPYYVTDCDMHSRLTMRGWSMKDARWAGAIWDVSVALDDLSVLYRVDGVTPSFTDPNPPPPKKGWFSSWKRDGEEEETKKNQKRQENVAGWLEGQSPRGSRGVNEALMSKREEENQAQEQMKEGEHKTDELDKWRALQKIAEEMYHYKHDSKRGRNTWQLGQQGGQGEPFYYPAAGIAKGIELLTETGYKVYREKWGHKDCDLITKGHLSFDDQWKVKKDWWF